MMKRFFICLAVLLLISLLSYLASCYLYEYWNFKWRPNIMRSLAIVSVAIASVLLLEVKRKKGNT